MPKKAEDTPADVAEMLGEFDPGQGDSVVAETDLGPAPENYNAFEESMQTKNKEALATIGAEEVKDPDLPKQTEKKAEPTAEEIAKDPLPDPVPQVAAPKEPAADPTKETKPEGPDAAALEEAILKAVNERAGVVAAGDLPDEFKNMVTPLAGAQPPAEQTQPAPTPAEQATITAGPEMPQLDFSGGHEAIVAKYGETSAEVAEMMKVYVEKVFETAPSIIQTLAAQTAMQIINQRAQYAQESASDAAAFYQVYPELKTAAGIQLVGANLDALYKSGEAYKFETRGHMFAHLGKLSTDQLNEIKGKLGIEVKARPGAAGENVGSPQARTVMDPAKPKTGKENTTASQAHLADMLDFADEFKEQLGQDGYVFSL